MVITKPLASGQALRTLARLGLSFLLVLTASPLLANGIVRDSLGAISSGRGGTNIAHSDNLSILHDNPAGMAWLPGGLQFELSADFLHRTVEYRDLDDGDDANDRIFVLPQLAFTARVPDTPVTFGLIATFPGGYGAEYDLIHDSNGTFSFGKREYLSEGNLLKILPTFGVMVNEYLSVGGGIGVGISQAQLNLPYTFQTGAFANQPALLELKSDGVGVTWNIGVQIRPTSKLTIGLSYISQTETDQEGDVDVDITGTPLSGLVTDPTATYDLDFRLRWPRSAHVGVVYDLDFGRISVDGSWFHWQDAFDEFHLNLSDGDNAQFNALAGPTPRDVIPLKWRDSFSIKLGYEHFFNAVSTLRVGYIYNLNPIPDKTLIPLFPGTLEHSFAVGYGHDFGVARIDLAYQYAFGREREVGTSALAGGDFNSSSLNAEAHWLMITVGIDLDTGANSGVASTP